MLVLYIYTSCYLASHAKTLHMHLTLSLVFDRLVLYYHWCALGVFCAEGLILPYLQFLTCKYLHYI